MGDSEKIAEDIMLYVYKCGNAVSVRKIKEVFKDQKDAIATDNMNTILFKYGLFFCDVSGNSYYKLNEHGIDFAAKGCFTGENKREKQTIRRANLSLILSGIAVTISLAATIISLIYR